MTAVHSHDHDLGLTHDLRVLTRRRAFQIVAALGASTVAACASDGTQTAPASETTPTSDTTTSTSPQAQAACAAAAPQETAGPYPGDGSNGPNVLIESGIVRSDIRSSFGSLTGTAEGVPMTLRLTLQDLTAGCAAGAGMAVYVWHCDRAGQYSLYSADVEDQNYLRGVQVADATGTVTFESIFPACYDGRWPHIHFEVFDSLESAVAGSDARLTSQIALPQQACETVFAADSGYATSVSNLSRVSLESDNVFGDGWDAELATVTGDAGGMAVAITVGVAEKSANAPVPGGPPPGNGERPPGPPPEGPR